jgi:hypothetical protein
MKLVSFFKSKLIYQGLFKYAALIYDAGQWKYRQIWRFDASKKGGGIGLKPPI